jgi:hypothetical protein
MNMKKKKFLLSALLALGFYWLMTNPAMADGIYDGNWEGTNDQGHDFSFAVTDGIVTSFQVKYTVTGTNCSATVEKTFNENFSIIGDSFTVSGRDYDALCPDFNEYEFTISFNDSSSASGTWFAENCFCDGTTNGTLSANREGQQDATDFWPLFMPAIIKKQIGF